MDPIPNSEPAIVVVTGASFEAEVLRSERPVLALFCAPWSQPCGSLEADLTQVAAACCRRVKVVKVNADENPDLGVWYDIASIPTLIYFAQGAPQDRTVGTASKEAILDMLRRHCPKDPASAE
jgi:thioredoxin 1